MEKVIKTNNKNYIDTLESVLQKRYYKDEYSLHGYQEDALCLEERIDHTWEIFSGERNLHHFVVLYDSLLLACLVFIRKMGRTDTDIYEMQNEFLNALMDDVDNDISQYAS